jgi:transposase-like protein
MGKLVRQAKVDHGQQPGTTSEGIAEIKALKKENAKLRRANEIFKSASAFFATENVVSFGKNLQQLSLAHDSFSASDSTDPVT